MIKAAIPSGQKPQDWMWIQYKRAQAAGPQPTRPEPLSVWPSGSASSGSYDHARSECMLQEVLAGVKWRRTALLHGRGRQNERPRPKSPGRGVSIPQEPMIVVGTAAIRFVSGTPSYRGTAWQEGRCVLPGECPSHTQHLVLHVGR